MTRVCFHANRDPRVSRVVEGGKESGREIARSSRTRDGRLPRLFMLLYSRSGTPPNIKSSALGGEGTGITCHGRET